MKKYNQDAVIHRFWKKNWCIAVCDGMGSKPLSHIGSSLACRSIYNVLKHCDFSLAEKDVAKKIYVHWLELLKEKISYQLMQRQLVSLHGVMEMVR
ncbi:protein phosphatase 2C domain-containing protein [Acinetobacter indicus]|nr:protein phosphatase 2C domain-containing protein [Acinetobacter indicus]